MNERDLFGNANHEFLRYLLLLCFAVCILLLLASLGMAAKVGKPRRQIILLVYPRLYVVCYLAACATPAKAESDR